MHDVFASDPPLRSGPPDVLTPDQWILHLFSFGAARRGGVVRRKVRDVERILGWQRFRDEFRRRGCRSVVNGGQVVGFCDAEPVHIVD